MSDTTSLPSQDYDNSDSGLSTYVIRITPCEKFTFQQAAEFFKAEPNFCNYVIGRETVPQEHFHLVVQTDDDFTIQEVRDVIRAFIIPFWQTPEGKLPRGFGNKQYNLQTSTDPDKAVSYAVKLNEYLYEGYTEEYITERRAESFEKKKPSDFKHEYAQLVDKFQSDFDMDIYDFMNEYNILKAKYGQMVVLSQSYAYAISNLIKREPDQSAQLTKDFLFNK